MKFQHNRKRLFETAPTPLPPTSSNSALYLWADGKKIELLLCLHSKK